MIRKSLLVFSLVAMSLPAACGDDDSHPERDANVTQYDGGTQQDAAGPGPEDGGQDQDAGQQADASTECTDDFAPQELMGMRIRFVESANNVDNTWAFDSVSATLEGASVTAPYTYERIDGCTSAVEFDVDGTDRYDMTWTSATGGDCTETWENGPPVDCTFEVVQ